MITIRNLNERYGMPITFSGKTEDDAVAAMQYAFSKCFPDENIVISEDDYEIVPDYLHQQERCILELTELICEKMNSLSISVHDLASHTGKSKKEIIRLLDGEGITLEAASDIFCAMGLSLHFQCSAVK